MAPLPWRCWGWRGILACRQQAESGQGRWPEVPSHPLPAYNAFVGAATCFAGTGLDLTLEQPAQCVSRRPAISRGERRACSGKQACSMHLVLAMLHRQEDCNTHLAPVLPLPANVSPAAGQAHAVVNRDQAVPLHQNVASIAVCRQQEAGEQLWRRQQRA